MVFVPSSSSSCEPTTALRQNEPRVCVYITVDKPIFSINYLANFIGICIHICFRSQQNPIYRESPWSRAPNTALHRCNVSGTGQSHAEEEPRSSISAEKTRMSYHAEWNNKSRSDLDTATESWPDRAQDRRVTKGFSETRRNRAQMYYSLIMKITGQR